MVSESFINSKIFKISMKILLFTFITLSVFINFLLVPSFLSPKTENINFIKKTIGLQENKVILIL
jgi:hypothetical protein